MREAALTRDAFLGGQLYLWQPKSGYRAGVDPVLLAASVDAVAGQSVLDVGCGVGAAGLCLATRVSGIALSGLELQATYADLARRNAKEAGIAAEIHVGDIANPPLDLKQHSFDHVLTNPPYFDRRSGTPARDPGRDQALVWQIPPANWVKHCLKRVKPGGWLHMIHRAEALPHLLRDMPENIGRIDICPIAPRDGRKAELILMRGKKDARRPLHLLAPIILHEGTQHVGDRDDYRSAITAVLRDGAALKLISR